MLCEATEEAQACARPLKRHPGDLVWRVGAFTCLRADRKRTVRHTARLERGVGPPFRDSAVEGNGRQRCALLSASTGVVMDASGRARWQEAPSPDQSHWAS